jgi:hypothetical protein
LVEPDLSAHIGEYVEDEPAAYVFLGGLGGRTVACHWVAASQQLPTGLAAGAGTTTRELIRRMEHSAVRMAVRYQLSTDRRDREIAAETSRRADTTLSARSHVARPSVTKTRQGSFVLVGRGESNP